MPTNTGNDAPLKEIVITDCGELKGDAALAADIKAPDSMGDPYEDFPEDCTENLDAQKILKIATECKDYGNTAFRAGNLSLGIAKYEKGLRYINEDPDLENEPPTTKAALDALRFSLNNNAALLNMKLSAWDDTVRTATAALAVQGVKDSDRAKALYRRGFAYVRLREEDSARQDLEEASQLVPDDPAIANELRLVRARAEASRRQEARAARRFFTS